MLVLTRKVGEGIGEGIKINDDVKITVIEVKGKNIRFGIEAPKTTKIYREEVFLKIKEENKIAASTPAKQTVLTSAEYDTRHYLMPQEKIEKA